MHNKLYPYADDPESRQALISTSTTLPRVSSKSMGFHLTSYSDSCGQCQALPICLHGSANVAQQAAGNAQSRGTEKQEDMKCSAYCEISVSFPRKCIAFVACSKTGQPGIRHDLQDGIDRLSSHFDCIASALVDVEPRMTPKETCIPPRLSSLIS